MVKTQKEKITEENEGVAREKQQIHLINVQSMKRFDLHMGLCSLGNC
jgi:hypothetical protein